MPPSKQEFTEVELPYSIHSWSSYSADYHPKNILIDNPSEQSSRWSSEENNLLQFILLRLEQVSLIRRITFGKYFKAHICNLKEFKIYGGLAIEHMMELFHGGLNNDEKKEHFSITCKYKELEVPCKFIKIVPILAWGSNFNFSIWYVRLDGICNPFTVSRRLKEYDELREREVIRLCLKYFRQKNYLEPFEALRAVSKIQLESPLLTKLYASLVTNGDFEKSERIIEEASKKDLFEEYINNQTYRPRWSRILPFDSNGQVATTVPCLRGGHQMVIDPENGVIYLFGGWDGEKDLGDFWSYSIPNNNWHKISDNTELQGGPCPRSCHSICIDTEAQKIYCLGRYVDVVARRKPQNILCDFFIYDIVQDHWSLLSSDTAKEGGPHLIFDHQMQISNEEKALIVFGGKIISSNESPLPYSGMYYYYYEDHQWVPITVEQHNVELMPRVGHSFLYDPRDEHVYIFSGQNANEPMSDFFVYNILKKKVTWAIADVRVEGGPEISFTQRSTIDPFRREIFVFGMHTKKGKREASTENSFWVYFIDKKKWVELASRKSSGVDEPCPRFAHQFVLDTKNKIHYLFGGNAGTERLNDFWSLRFYKVQKEDVIKQALYFIRKQKFLEMSVDDKFGALRYLQACLAETLDQYDEEQLKDFRSLTSHLFNTSMDAERNKFIKIRSTVYETLLKFFPSSIKQPEENLLDLITEK